MRGHYPNCPDPANRWGQVKKYSSVLSVALLIAAVQITAGLYFEILSLVADGVHTGTHGTAYLIALIAAMCILLLGFNEEKTDKNTSYIIIGLLFLTVFWIVFESADRLLNQQKEIVGWIMAVGGLFGFIGNQIEYHILKNAPDKHKDHTHASITFHVITDRALSIAVFVGGIANQLTGSSVIDPVISLFIACWIFWGTVKLIKDTRRNNAAP